VWFADYSDGVSRNFQLDLRHEVLDIQSLPYKMNQPDRSAPVLENKDGSAKIIHFLTARGSGRGQR